MPGFDAEVRASGRGSHAVVVPKGVLAELGTRRVRATISTESFEATLGAYGGRTFLGLRKSLLTAAGVAAGDSVHVDLEPASPIEEPAEQPQPTTCAELDEALGSDDALRLAWQALPDDHGDEYGRWISGADDPETRRVRIARVRARLTRPRPAPEH